MLQGWLEAEDTQTQDDDAFESRVRSDLTSGYFDTLIAQVIAKDETGKTFL